VAVAAALDMPPVQTYCVNILFNWRRLAIPGKPVSMHTTPDKAHSSSGKQCADTSPAIPQLGEAVSLNVSAARVFGCAPWVGLRQQAQGV
jgi:hypothetical protein